MPQEEAGDVLPLQEETVAAEGQTRDRPPASRHAGDFQGESVAGGEYVQAVLKTAAEGSRQVAVGGLKQLKEAVEHIREQGAAGGGGRTAAGALHQRRGQQTHGEPRQGSD